MSFVVISTLVLACTTSGIAASVTPVSSTTSLIAIADAEGTQVKDTSTMSQLASVNPLFSSVTANAVGGATNSTATANVFAQWDSFNPGQGRVTFSNVGGSITAGPNCTGNCGADLSTGFDYQYTFTSASAMRQYFFVIFDVVASTPQTSGLDGFSLWFNGSCSDLGLGATGSDRFLLLPGDTYTLNMKNLADISITGPGTFNEGDKCIVSLLR